jgi:hypothetical protein
MALSDRQQAFVDEYLIDRNATQAYIRAGYSEKGAGQSAHTLLNNPEIQVAIRDGLEKIANATTIDAAWVMRELAKIASADPNELIENRMCNCRHCHGDGHRYQLTDAEMAKKRKAYDKNKPRRGGPARRADPEVWDEDDDFDYEGGAGFNRYRPPNVDCPECAGVGESVVVPRDTRLLSPAARALYAGVRVTATGGFEIKMRDQNKALEMLGKHLGMFVDRQALVNADGTDKEFAPIMFVPVEAKPREDGE